MRYTITVEGDYITFIDTITGRKKSYRKNSFKSLHVSLTDDYLILVQVGNITTNYNYHEVEDPSTPGIAFTSLSLFRDFILINTEIGGGSGSGGGVIQGTVADYASLPSPASAHTGELYYVTNNSGGHWTRVLKKNYYEYPSGLYISDGTSWEQSIIQVQLAEDAQTLVNITNWAEFLTIGPQANIGDRIIYNNIQYENLTGVIASTAPDTDITNWTMSTNGLSETDDIKRYIFLMNN